MRTCSSRVIEGSRRRCFMSSTAAGFEQTRPLHRPLGEGVLERFDALVAEERRDIEGSERPFRTPENLIGKPAVEGLPQDVPSR